MGRVNDPRTENVQLRVTPEEKARIQAAAQSERRSVSNWIMSLIMREIETPERPLKRVAEPKKPAP